MNQLLGGSAWANWQDLATLLLRLVFDLAVATALIRGIYARRYGDRDYVFTYYVFNIITFCLCLMLRKVAVEIGFALALFGVFGILRYRTEQIRIRDLTYLFVLIGVGILNAIADAHVSVLELVTVNVVIVAMIALLERRSAGGAERSTPMSYDQLELLLPGNEGRLMADLVARTGLAVNRVEVQRFDLLHDAADITIYHRERR